MWRSQANLDGIGKYRIRLLALELEEFTVKELEAAAGVSPQVVHAFIRNELDIAGPNLVEREKLETGGKPGRPPFHYRLTPEGIEVLAKRNLALAVELNTLIRRQGASESEILNLAQPLPDSREAVKEHEKQFARRTPLAPPAVPASALTPVENQDEVGKWMRGLPSSAAASIDNSLVFKGEISGSASAFGSVFIDGHVEGAINLPDHRITIGRKGQVNASVVAKGLVVLGKVHGNVAAIEVDVRSGGSLTGDVVCQRIAVDDDAFFKGGIDIRKSKEILAPAESIAPAEAESAPQERVYR